jgi:RNA polymerase-binding transcription factor DksA
MMKQEKSIQEAMTEVAEDMSPQDMSVKPVAPVDEGDSPADKQVIVRLTLEERENWKAAADKNGQTLSAFIRDLCNARAEEVLVCSHPVNQRRFYPWAEFCLKCNTRMR